MKTSLHRICSSARCFAGVVATCIAVVTHSSATAQQMEVIPYERQLVAQLQAMPEGELKETYLHCWRESTHRVMGYGEIALCSIVYETVLRRIFAGYFDALLAWSRLNAGYALENTFLGTSSRQP
jgi:hypothetical protein